DHWPLDALAALSAQRALSHHRYHSSQTAPRRTALVRSHHPGGFCVDGVVSRPGFAVSDAVIGSQDGGERRQLAICHRRAGAERFWHLLRTLSALEQLGCHIPADERLLRPARRLAKSIRLHAHDRLRRTVYAPLWSRLSDVTLFYAIESGASAALNFESTEKTEKTEFFKRFFRLFRSFRLFRTLSGHYPDAIAFACGQCHLLLLSAVRRAERRPDSWQVRQVMLVSAATFGFSFHFLAIGS